MKFAFVIALNLAIIIAAIFGMAAANVFYFQFADPIPSLMGGIYGIAHAVILAKTIEL